MRVMRDVVRLPPSVTTALPNAAKTLELAWQRRWQELAGWQPSGGWLVEPRVPGVSSAMQPARPD